MTERQWKPTSCILCECNCGIEVTLGGDDGRQLTRFRGDRRHPGSRGYVCEKPARLNYYQNAPDRLPTPLRRRADGSFEPISWEVAISEIAGRLAAVRDEHGGASIFYYGGGGQGNHLPGVYAASTRRALGVRYKSSALAQEKTGEFFVADRMLGAQTRGDFERCQVGLFLGKNPWQSHSIARARVTLKELSRDPERTLIVVDPRRTESAQLADIHLQVRPGTDAWLLSALIAVLFEEDLLDHDFIAGHVDGVEAVRAAFEGVPIAAYSQRAGVSEDEVRRVARVIAGAASYACFEDLGVQMNRHSTLVSYLNRLLWVLTGNFGKEGTHYTVQGLVRFAWGDTGKKSPVVGAPIISGLVPCNVIAEEILTDHPARYRAMIVEAANPAHSLADSPRVREALRALDTLVVIDVALTETAQLADYVLPTATQFEKAEATFFNFEFPDNYFHLRHPLLPPPEGLLPEAEIHARLCEALGAFDDAFLAPLRAAAAQGLPAYGQAFFEHVLSKPRYAGFASVLLYRTLGPVLPEAVREGAPLLGLAFRVAMQGRPEVARAGFDGPPPVAAMKLFDAILNSPSGFVMQSGRWDEVRVQTASGRVQAALPELLAELERLREAPEESGDFPFVLSAGERRSFTANTIIRDPAWRRRDAHGALRISPQDAARLGIVGDERVRVSTPQGAVVVPVEICDTMQAGHISLPNGLGLRRPVEDSEGLGGVAPNELTAVADRDPFVGTPWHKAVPAQVERLQAE
jgi:anaerobic selenocysteine-containing dehydrogenase